MPIDRLTARRYPASRPAPAAKRLEVGLGAGARVRDHLGGAQPAEPGALDRAHAVGEPEEEAGREEIAGARRVDAHARRRRPAPPRAPAPSSTTAPWAPRVITTRSPVSSAAATALLGRGGAEEHRHLFLVAEQDVDVVEEQVEELALVPATQKGSDSDRATEPSDAWAVAAAWRIASLAAGTSHR